MPNPNDNIPGIPTSTTGGPQPVIRRAYPSGPEKPQWLKGKLTFIGLAISTIGMIGKLFGLTLPVDEANAALRWLSENWETIAQGVGIFIAGYGRLRINWRES